MHTNISNTYPSVEVELTDQLIKELVQEKLYHDETSLKKLKVQGAKWNVRKIEVVLPNHSE